ncbi:plasma membrane protein [Coprinopsis sp. MPI-PUGE-AT-0042]|nr:plasma membrane protein [Coprinopsis sp. MPI-PUGE-AT-0042]
MDTGGWSAKRRAERESELYAHVHRDAAGNYVPVEAIAQPLPELFIGGFQPHHGHAPPLAKHEGHKHAHHPLGHHKAHTDGGVQQWPQGNQAKPLKYGGVAPGQEGGAANVHGSTKPVGDNAGPPSPLPPPIPSKDGQYFERIPGMPYPTNDGLQYRDPYKPIPHAEQHGGIPAPLPKEPTDDSEAGTSSTMYNPTDSLILSAKQLVKMSAVERSRLLRVARMEPHLQFMCGPLLKFDTIDENGVWHGAALVVTSDSGSIYEPFPTLTYEWDPERVLTNTFSRFERSSVSSAPDLPNRKATDSRKRSFSLSRMAQGKLNKGEGGTGNGLNTPSSPIGAPPSAWNTKHGVPSFDLGPHPADPHSTLLPASPPTLGIPLFSATSNTSTGTPPTSSNGHLTSPSSTVPTSLSPSQSSNGHTPVASAPLGGPNGYGILNPTPQASPTSHIQQAQGQDIYVYGGLGGTFTFWRFKIEVPLGERDMGVRYSVNGGQRMEFYVPARSAGMRLAVHSCNGFSAGVNTDEFRGPGFKSGYDPVWMDLLSKHSEAPFHVLVGGGDQLYCDSLMREPELQEWVHISNQEEKKNYPLTDEMSLAIDRFFFNHYCQHFRSGAFARANCSIPMLNMCDDHDLIDGFGSYPDDLQMAPVFRAIGARGYHFFLLFQCFINPEVDGVSDVPNKHFYKSMIIGPDPGPFIPFPSHSTLSRIGPKEWILMLDCRAERKKDQVCSPGEYAKVFQQLHALPPGVEHLIIQIGIPIAYPRMVFLETALESKFNPLVALGKAGNLGLGGFVNKFNKDAELLDDLSDHWTARNHKKERNWFIEQLQNFARSKRIRVSFVSGDVHCSAVGYFKTLKQKNAPEIAPEEDWRYMQNITTSAIVNTPPPNGVITMVSSLATKVHKTLHHIDTDESMLPIFTQDPSGAPRKQKYVMGRRNWCRIERDVVTDAMVFDIRVEREKGYGATVGYITQVPPPRWIPTAAP